MDRSSPYSQDNGTNNDCNEERDVSYGVGGTRVQGLTQAEVIREVEPNGTADIVELQRRTSRQPKVTERAGLYRIVRIISPWCIISPPLEVLV